MTRMTGSDCAVMCNLINIHTVHTYSGQFMGCPSGGRGPSRERDRDYTSRSGSRRMGGRGGRGAEGRGGGVGAGVLDSENNERIHWQPSLMGRLS